MNNQIIGNGLLGGFFIPTLLGSGGTEAQKFAMIQESQARMAEQFAQQRTQQRDFGFVRGRNKEPIKRKKVESREVESTIPQSTHLLYGGG